MSIRIVLGFIFIASFSKGGFTSQVSEINSYNDYLELDLNTIQKTIQPHPKIDQLNLLFDFADSLNENARNVAERKKANLTISFLAFILENEINEGNIEPTDRKTISLLRNLEKHKFIIARPNYNYLTKLLIYVCEGRYGYVLFRFQNSKISYPALICIALFLALELLFLFKFFKSKNLGKLNRFLLYSSIAFILVLLAFKLTCSSCIDNYTFYGIRL